MSRKPSYAILRIGKIKSLSMLDAVELHNTRQIPAGTVDGLPPPEDLVEMTGSYRRRFAQVLADIGATYEKGKVLAVEVLVTASPEWWDKAKIDEKAEWWRAQLRFANDLFGPGLIAFTPHVDESTPHAQFVGLPLYHDIVRKRGKKPQTPEAIRKRAEEEARAPKIWRLSHDRVFGGSPKRLAELQTTYHGYVKHLGLARGRDTVGVGIKHTTLKHYKKLLTQMDLDLEREAAEQLEEREILDHYDAELREKHERFAKDQTELSQREQELEIICEAHKAHQRDLDARATELDVYEAALHRRSNENEQAAVARERRLAEVEVRLNDDRRTVMSDSQRLQDRNREADGREAILANREMALGVKEQVLQADIAHHKTVAAQLSIVGGLFTGRLSGTWDRDRRRPHIAQGKLDEHETRAAAQPWPDWLAMAARRATEMAMIRSSLAQRAREIRARLNRKRSEVRLALIAAHDRVTQALKVEGQAQKVKLDLLGVQMATTDYVHAAEKRATEARGQAVLADAARDEAFRQKDEAVRARVSVEQETVEVRNDLMVLQGERSDLTTEVKSLKEEREDLASELAKLCLQKDALEDDRRQLGRAQLDYVESVERLDRTRRLITDLVAARIDIAFDGDNLRITPGRAAATQESKSLARTTVEPWIETVIRQHYQRTAAVSRVEEVEKELKGTRAALAVRYPERAEELRDEQAAETKAIDKRLLRHPAGMDGMGM